MSNLTHFIPVTDEQLQEIKSGSRKELLTLLFKREPRSGDGVFSQSKLSEHAVTLTSVYEGKGINAKYKLVSWQAGFTGWEFGVAKAVGETMLMQEQKGESHD